MKSKFIVDLKNFKSGFCDRLKKITFYVAYAKVKKIKKIFIYEQKTKECPFLFTDLCYFQGFKLIRINKLPKYYIEKFQLNEYNSNVNIETCKFFLKDFSKKKLQSFLKEWENSYIYLRPKKIIKLKISKIMKNKKILVGLHFRLTDKLISIKEKLLELPWKDTVTKSELLKFKDKLFNQLIYKNDNFFVASDEEKTKKEIIGKLRYYNKNYLFNSSIFKKNKLRQTSGEDFIIDLFLLSKCKDIYTSGGGVSDTAKLISKKIHLIKWNKTTFFFIDIKKFSLLIYKLRKFINKFLL